MDKCACCEVVDVEPLPALESTIDFGLPICKECGRILATAQLAIFTARRIDVPKYGSESWRNISAEEHGQHAYQHLMSFAANRSDEDHLAHAICRLVMAKAFS